MISRGTNKYVEVYEEKEVPSHGEEKASGIRIEKSIATKQQEHSSPPSNPPLQEVHTDWPTEAITLHDSVPADCIEKEVNSATAYIDVLASRNRSRNRKTNSRSTSECKEYHSKQHSKMKEEQTGSKKMAHNLKTHSRTDALITDLQKTDRFNLLSEKP